MIGWSSCQTYRSKLTVTPSVSANRRRQPRSRDPTQRTARRHVGILPRIRDNALITLGRAHAEITAHLLTALTASRLAAAGHPDAGLLARLGKAAGVDAAVAAVAGLAPLIGASGFQRHHRIAKARADLTGLLYADGIHDSLYRSGGVTLLAAAGGAPTPAPAVAAAA
ncbi:Acyl-CoA dehydrogenase, C-terminal domain [Micromonospora pattaloongensis]|uniref:Acyl-CoA dehydrogenase, C-terminal domain n=1 Tax=Micromonospora pattaloongensis TaxID=405436 RepID=A0A1H3T0D5_9ACTN|nr:Acyl-CoA dehydrogenase, C-terminal domain [Micromonospora pattaloongensis]